ncbi:Leucine Rich Repeat family protein [Trichomonas vaginalis G3]|uniref:Leucine Rich Repeat family protein n=1 Tax=Trichomonas vaginalis (strain ATCC PRA-98 / G3) TaxID=412133 RepID=A2EQ44_TRIV3|nr:uncharacterized protein TVAGG3_0072610 [Trichomonas vaginalis G3]EAY05219.1 Leucine Rich Repeat family protein [Trichomonas vaginalis G3]KAI5542614.1 ribonuclease inhibitor domain-containing protein [Trichomonas vaginalis G3]|eukprot:XP_001317442.1 hypothetical protein [Trichomonas vaginalis G3]
MLLSNVLKKSPPSLQARATSQNVYKIDIVPLQYQSLTDLFVSHNTISNLRNVDQFHQLRRLMAEFNEIQYIDDIAPLKNLKQLKELKLNGNPVCYYPFWEYHVLKFCPQLEMLNGKPVNKENVKFAMMEDDLTKAVYYLDLTNFIIQQKNRLPQTPTTEISNLLRKKIKAEDLSKFRRKFASGGPQDIEPYKNYIISKCINSCNSISSKLTPKHDKKLSENHVKFLNVMKSCDKMDDLAKVMKLQLGNDLNIGGFHADQDFTNIIRDAFKDDPNASRLIQDCIEIASQYDPKSDINNLDINKSPSPKKKKLLPQKNNPQKTEVPEIINNNPHSKLVVDPNSILSFTADQKPKLFRIQSQSQLTIEQDDFLSKSMTPIKLIEPPANFAVTQRRKSYSNIQRKASLKQNDDDSDGEKFSDLSFESQLRRELVEQRNSMSSQLFSDASMTDEDRAQSEKYWPRKRPPKVPLPSSKEAKKFTDNDWEVKLFIEKRQRAFMKRVFNGWRSTHPSRKLRRRSSFSVEYLSNGPPVVENTVVGDNFLNAFLNNTSSQPDLRVGSHRRSSFSMNRRLSYNPSASSPIIE